MQIRQTVQKKYKLALLGNPISHSISPQIHKMFADMCRVDIDYIKIDTDIPGLKDTVEYLKSENFSGFNCTMPLKEEIVKYINEKSNKTNFLNVCNTVKIKNNILYGHTTDGEGMISGIKRAGTKIKNKNVLMFGAGGAAKSILYSLVENGAKKIIVLNRSKKNLESVKRLFIHHKNVVLCDFLNSENLEKYVNHNGIGIVINASRLGMNGSEESFAFDPEYGFLNMLEKEAVIADAVYDPIKTKLLAASQKAGYKTAGGLCMLVCQGALSFKFWTNKTVPEECIEKILKIYEK